MARKLRLPLDRCLPEIDARLVDGTQLAIRERIDRVRIRCGAEANAETPPEGVHQAQEKERASEEEGLYEEKLLAPRGDAPGVAAAGAAAPGAAPAGAAAAGAAAPGAAAAGAAAPGAAAAGAAAPGAAAAGAAPAGAAAAGGASLAPPVIANSATRSQWLTRDAAARLAIRNHLPLAKCAQFGQHRTARALYDAVVARYSSSATAALGRLLLPYLFLELSAFATVEDLVTHLRTSNARYRSALPAEFLDRNPSPMYITLYFIVTRLPESLCAIRDHFLAPDPTALTVDLLEQHLLAAETSVVAVGATRGTPRTPFF
ncbi:unnamed protein product [Closterium sp. NIES-53]